MTEGDNCMEEERSTFSKVLQDPYARRLIDNWTSTITDFRESMTDFGSETDVSLAREHLAEARETLDNFYQQNLSSAILNVVNRRESGKDRNIEYTLDPSDGSFYIDSGIHKRRYLSEIDNAKIKHSIALSYQETNWILGYSEIDFEHHGVPEATEA